MTSPTGREVLQLAVEAITDDAQRAFLGLSSSSERASTSAKETGESVARAADRVQQARLKQADAADAVRLAEVRLQELLDKGNASTTQLATANTRLEAARRRQHVATRDLEGATEGLTRAEREAVTATDEAGAAAGRAGIDLKGLAAQAGALAGGVTLGSWARDSITAFMETARGAQQLSASMNSTIVQGGQLAQLFGSLGLEASDLLEIQAEFAQKIEADSGALAAFGAQVMRNADGTVNWASTLRDTLGALQRIPDATERNRTGFRLFGEEGYKQLSSLLTSGRSVDEIFEKIGTPVTASDLREVQAFDSAMLDLNLTSGELGRTLGRAVIPLITGLVDAGQTAATVIGSIPGPVATAAAASVLLGIGMKRASTEGTLLAGVLARASAAAAIYTGAATRGAGASALLSRGLGAARGAGAGLAGALGGPVGIALIGVGIGVEVVNSAVDTFEGKARTVAVNAELAEQRLGDMAATSHELGEQMVETAGTTDGWVASVRGANMAVEALTEDTAADVGIFQQFAGSLLGAADATFDLGLAEAGATAEIERQREALGAAGLQTEASQIAVKGLNDLIAEGTTTGSEFTDAVRAAAEAEREQSETSDLAKASIDAYNATTRDAVETTLALAEAQLGQRSGLRDVQEALYELGDVVEDTATPWSEVAAATDDAISTALDYASASSDAAVEAARATGTILTPLAEAKIRGQETIRALYETLQQPGITDSARKQVGDLIHDLQAAQDAGDVEAILKLTGGPETKDDIDEATADRDTTVRVESRNGPAVDRYLDGLAEQRLALIRVESRNGPAVREYLDSLCRERLAIIRVETRGGPAVERYLDDLARDREVALTPRGNGGAGTAGSGLRGAPTLGAAAGSGMRLGGTVEVDLRLTGSIDRSQIARAERGRAHVEDIRAYEQRNGTGWRSR